MSIILVLLVLIGGIAGSYLTFRRSRKDMLEAFMLKVAKTIHKNPAYLDTLTPRKPLRSLREKHTPTPNRYTPTP